MINFTTRLVIGIGIFDLLEQSNWSKEQAKKADKLARNRRFQEALELNINILQRWSQNPSYWEQKLRQWQLGNLLNELEKKKNSYQLKLDQFNQLKAQADQIIQSDQADSFDTKNLSEALALYQQCLLLSHSDPVVATIQSLEETIRERVYLKFKSDADQAMMSDKNNPFNTKKLSEALELYQQCQLLKPSELLIATIRSLEVTIEQRNQFKLLINEAKELGKQHFYKKALAKFTEASQLFNHNIVEKGIEACQSRLKYEEKYEQFLLKSYQLAQAGDFRQAIKLIKPVIAKFPRSDGQELLSQLQQIIKSKISFQAGLLAEKNGNLETAKIKYQEAINFVPELEEYKIRLIIVEIKNHNYSQALSELENNNQDIANYLKGYIYAQLGHFEKASEIWLNHPNVNVEKQRQNLLKLAQKQKLIMMQSIEHLVDKDQLQQAQELSIECLQKYPEETLVKIT
jgi:tetratricopeptide (TPR) repeat protein